MEGKFKMKVTKKQIQRSYFLLVASLIIGFAVIEIFFAVSDSNHNSESTEKFGIFVREKMESILQNEVTNRVDEIQYDLSILNEEQMKVITEKISRVSDLMTTSETAEIGDMENRRIEGLNIFESIVQTDEEYLYFAFSVDGRLLRSGTDDRIEGISLIDSKDKDGVNYVREIVKAYNEPDGVYVTYHWPKEKDGEPFRKTSYCLYVPEFDIIIGVGSYEVDLELALKEKTFSRIQSYYKDSDEYMFIVNYDGTAKVFGNESLIGTDIRSILDLDGTSIHDNIMEAIESDREGFVTYNYTKKDSDIVSEKVSYVKSLDRWESYIGMGYHVDDLNEELNIYKEEYTEEHKKVLVVSIVALIGISVVIFYFIKRVLKLQASLLLQDEIVYKQLFQLSTEAIIIVSSKGDVLYQNPVTVKIFGKTFKKHLKGNGELDFDEVEEAVFSFVNDTDRTYYLDLKREGIVYQNVDSYIYFINNITSSYTKSHKFEQLALYDELTTLPNRRKLSNDFEDIIDDLDNLESVVLSIVDLDNFKNINDKYGHDIGDEVLKLLGGCFKTRLREGDYFYRYGGEEFVAILKNTGITEAQAVLAGINKTFSECNEKELGFPITFSGGVVILDKDMSQSLASVLKVADILLYQAKTKGRNRIEIELDDSKQKR